MNEEKKNSILIVDDERSEIMALTHILSSEFTIYVVKDSRDAMEAAKKHLPDIILLDVIMPEMDGHEVITALKGSDETKEIPVIFITGLTDREDEEKGLDLGAADYISKPFSPAIVKLRIRNQFQMLNQIREIERLTLTDQLTGIFNRRGFDNRMQMEWGRAIRENSMLSILMLDVDRFKNYNDSYGHQQGDQVLKEVAKVASQTLKRPGDLAARWGGEEFVVLLPNTDIEGALNIAEQIRVNIENMVIPCRDGTETKVTVSIGVNAQMPHRSGSMEDFISKADKALYQAKDAGRNQVCSAM